jgi:hypothetical protein
MSEDPKLQLKRVVQSRGEAAGYLKSPGDAVLIERGRPRWLLLSCPCGCGEELPINLDSRAGPAWRLYKNAKLGVSVYPSVWRDTGCGSHFIIWRDSIFLFGQDDDYFGWRGRDEEMAVLSEAVRERLIENKFVSYVDISDLLGEVPWDVLHACRSLVRKGIAREGMGKQRGTFRRI